MLPGIVGSSLAMPDIHQGYGFPIGGVAATDWTRGVVSPGGVGFDINCGVRSVTTTLNEQEVRPKLRDLVNQVFRDVPSGTGGEGPIQVSPKQLHDVLEKGARWMVESGYGEERDLEYSDHGGSPFSRFCHPILFRIRGNRRLNFQLRAGHRRRKAGSSLGESGRSTDRRADGMQL
jgi:RNA-splicing ligase RtcB